MGLAFGVHNDEYNMDFYENGTVRIYSYKENVGLITEFDAETMALFVTLLKRDGHLDRLFEINKKRLAKLGFDFDRFARFRKVYESY